MSVSAGDLVKYVRPYPPEAHLVYEVAEVKEVGGESWVLLVEEVEEDVEVFPGVMGGFGCWEESKEFTKVQ